jgi:hypothetical protein
MAFEVMAWAVKQDVPNSGAKLVLLLLANHTNGHTGQCNPSQALLAKECSMGVSTLRRHLADLEEAGFISVVHQYAENMKRPNQYIVNFQTSPQTSTEDQNRAIDPPNWRYSPSKSDVPLPPNRMIETGSKNTNRNSTVDQQGNPLFDVFWKAYPRKVSPSLAKKSFAKLKVDEALLEKIVKAVELQKKTVWKDKDQQYIPHPSTWLNNQRWEDEIAPLPSTGNSYNSLLNGI